MLASMLHKAQEVQEVHKRKMHHVKCAKQISMRSEGSAGLGQLSIMSPFDLRPFSPVSSPQMSELG